MCLLLVVAKLDVLVPSLLDSAAGNLLAAELLNVALLLVLRVALCLLLLREALLAHRVRKAAWCHLIKHTAAAAVLAGAGGVHSACVSLLALLKTSSTDRSLVRAEGRLVTHTAAGATVSCDLIRSACGVKGAGVARLALVEASATERSLVVTEGGLVKHTAAGTLASRAGGVHSACVSLLALFKASSTDRSLVGAESGLVTHTAAGATVSCDLIRSAGGVKGAGVSRLALVEASATERSLVRAEGRGSVHTGAGDIARRLRAFALKTRSTLVVVARQHKPTTGLSLLDERHTFLSDEAPLSRGSVVHSAAPGTLRAGRVSLALVRHRCDIKVVCTLAGVTLETLRSGAVARRDEVATTLLVQTLQCVEALQQLLAQVRTRDEVAGAATARPGQGCATLVSGGAGLDVCEVAVKGSLDRRAVEAAPGAVRRRKRVASGRCTGEALLALQGTDASAHRSPDVALCRTPDGHQQHCCVAHHCS